MRILHTSDWHAGRRWKGIRRLDEMAAVLDHLAGFVETEKIDLILHSGDLFDGRNPPAEAERMVNEFFVRTGRAGAKTVVIAGNHDDPARMDARALLAEAVGTEMVGKPRPADRGGARVVDTRCGQRALVAALPFASPGLWVSALDLAGDEGEARTRYALMFQLAVNNLRAAFGAGTVNCFMAHTHLEGVQIAGSERLVHIGTDWAATPQSLPGEAHYIALGHIHKPQKVPGTTPAYYAGSPLQLDFGEVGQEKTFNLIEAKPGRPATVRQIPYEGGRTLRDVRGSFRGLERKKEAGEIDASAWLRVNVQLDAPDPDINRKVRALFPNALAVRIELPEVEAEKSPRPPAGAAPAELYRAYHRGQHDGRDPSDAETELFLQLYETAGGDA